MKEINENLLNTLKNEYLNNPINTVSRHALTNSKIIDIVRINEQTGNTRNMFSINIETLPACNQKSSVKVNIKLIKKFNIKLIEKFNIDFPITGILLTSYWIFIFYFFPSISSNLPFSL